MKRRTRPLIIGLTGGIASGKTLAVKEFERLGAGVIEGDELSRSVVQPGTVAWKKIRAAFGNDMVRPNGSINRRKLGKIVFADTAKRKLLEKITHPAIISEIKKRVKQLSQQPGMPLIVVDIPLLYEAGLERLVDAVVVVWVPRSIQVRRLKGRDKLSVPEIRLRLNAQWGIDTKKERADYVIDNSRSRQATRAQIKKLWQDLTKSFKYV